MTDSVSRTQGDLAVDPIALSQALIRRPSVAPADAGALDILEGVLLRLGFACRRMRFGEIENLFAQVGEGGPHFCFAGHTDVVPAGAETDWTRAPFSGVVEAGILFGRGAADMKSAIAAFVAAVARRLAKGPVSGTISLLITGDEEGPADDGTRRMVETLLQEKVRIDHCLVGEPTSAAVLGDMIKIGRRGSVNAVITVEGIQGHVAYPDRAANPLPVLVRILDRLATLRLDEGYQGFQPSNLEITNIEVGNLATNVIPARASGRVNVRFNPAHTGAGVSDLIRSVAEAEGRGFKGKVEVKADVSGEAFLTPPGTFTDLLASAVEGVVGRRPELSTTGGTSDARFIRALCPVVEFGLVGASMHKVDEHAPVADILNLSAIYERLLASYFAGGGA